MKQEQIIKIKTEYIKLDQLLKFAGIAESGGMAKEIIMSGDVFVNGEKCEIKGKKIRKNDEISLDEIIIKVESEI
ncbi:MAG: RNA-binding S4 domain-containing protein [Oscillospiraceae bacterium]